MRSGCPPRTPRSRAAATRSPGRWPNIENMRRQFKTMGAMFEWEPRSSPPTPSTTAGTSGCSCASWRPAWPIAQKSPVDWCPNDGTLAREQVEGADRHCWRCGALVEKRDLDQWYLRTTAYADELLDFERHRLARADPDPADQLDRPLRGRRDRLRDRPVDHHAGRRRAPRLHDAPGHAVRGDVHGPGPRAPAGADADRTRTGWPRSRPTSAQARRRTEIDRLSTDREKTGVAHRRRRRSTRSTASGSRSSSPTTCWPATAPARSWPCPPTTSATSRSPQKFGLPIRRVVAAPGDDADAPMDDAYIAHAADESTGQQRPVRRAARRRGRQGDRRRAGGARAPPSRRSPTACATG